MGWDVDQVREWLENLAKTAPALLTCIHNFTDNGVDGATLLSATLEDLSECGLKALLAKRVLKEITLLREGNAFDIWFCWCVVLLILCHILSYNSLGIFYR